MRKKIYSVVEVSRNDSLADEIYWALMLVFIILSIVPLMFLTDYPFFRITEKVCVGVFILDYLLRWITADMKMGKGKWSFLLYPFTPMAIIDLLSILPALSVINKGFKLFRLTRAAKIVRVFKLLRYSWQIQLLARVLKKEKSVMLSLLVIAIFYVFLTALIMFNVEPRLNPVTGEPTFQTFFDALYWATVTLTTVGYGDVCPVTEIGRFVGMMSSLFGIAIIALPSGVITASYLDELRKGNGRFRSTATFDTIKDVRSGLKDKSSGAEEESMTEEESQDN